MYDACICNGFCLLCSDHHSLLLCKRLPHLQELGRLKHHRLLLRTSKESSELHEIVHTIRRLQACIQASCSYPSQKVSLMEFAVSVLRGPRASCSIVAPLIQEPWQHQPSSIYCHPSVPRSVVFPCSLRTHRLSTVGYVPCTTEKISGIPYGRLCLGDENHTLTVGDCSHPPNCFLLGCVCGSMNESRKAISFVSDSNY